MKKTIEEFDRNPYLTNENFRKHYENPVRNFMKKKP